MYLSIGTLNNFKVSSDHISFSFLAISPDANVYFIPIGYTASLYYYNESTRELEFICKDTVAEDGTVSLSFTHASDYVIVIDGDEEESEDTTEPAQPEAPDGDSNGAAETRGNMLYSRFVERCA